MKRKWVIGGSVGAGVLLVLVMLTTVVSAQTVKSNEIRTNLIKIIRDKKINANLAVGGIIDSFRFMIFVFLLIITAFFSGNLFY